MEQRGCGFYIRDKRNIKRRIENGGMYQILNLTVDFVQNVMLKSKKKIVIINPFILKKKM